MRILCPLITIQLITGPGAGHDYSNDAGGHVAPANPSSKDHTERAPEREGGGNRYHYSGRPGAGHYFSTTWRQAFSNETVPA